MADARIVKTVSVPTPTASTHAVPRSYIDGILTATPSDYSQYGDQFSMTQRVAAWSQDTLSVGFLSFSGGPVNRPLTAATKLRFNVRGVVAGSATVTLALFKGASRTALTKQGADLVVTSSFAAVGTKEVTIPALSASRGEFLYLAILRLGTGTPDPAMATTGGPPTTDFYNPSATNMVTGYKSGLAAIPATLDTSAAFTGSGRIFWFSLA